MRLRTSERGDSVKQNENSVLQENAIEARLISSAGASRERRGKSRCLFFFACPGTGLKPSGVGVSAALPQAVREGVQERRRPRILPVSEPLRDLDGYPADIWTPRFQTRSGPRDGGRILDSFCPHVDAAARGSRLASMRCSGSCHAGPCGSNEAESPKSCTEMEGKRIQTFTIVRVVRNGSEAAGRPSDGRGWLSA